MHNDKIARNIEKKNTTSERIKRNGKRNGKI